MSKPNVERDTARWPDAFAGMQVDEPQLLVAVGVLVELRADAGPAVATAVARARRRAPVTIVTTSAASSSRDRRVTVDDGSCSRHLERSR